MLLVFFKFHAFSIHFLKKCKVSVYGKAVELEETTKKVSIWSTVFPHNSFRGNYSFLKNEIEHDG